MRIQGAPLGTAFEAFGFPVCIFKSPVHACEVKVRQRAHYRQPSYFDSRALLCKPIFVSSCGKSVAINEWKGSRSSKDHPSRDLYHDCPSDLTHLDWAACNMGCAPGMGHFTNLLTYISAE